MSIPVNLDGLDNYIIGKILRGLGTCEAKSGFSKNLINQLFEKCLIAEIRGKIIVDTKFLCML